MVKFLHILKKKSEIEFHVSEVWIMSPNQPPRVHT